MGCSLRFGVKCEYTLINYKNMSRHIVGSFLLFTRSARFSGSFRVYLAVIILNDMYQFKYILYDTLKLKDIVKERSL